VSCGFFDCRQRLVCAVGGWGVANEEGGDGGNGGGVDGGANRLSLVTAGRSPDRCIYGVYMARPGQTMLISTS